MKDIKERDKELARSLFDNPELIDLLERHLIEYKEPDPADMDQMRDEDAGQFIKTDRRAHKKIKSRWNKLKVFAAPDREGAGKSVPE